MIEFETIDGYHFAYSKGTQLELWKDRGFTCVHSAYGGEENFWRIKDTYDEAKAKIEAFERGGERRKMLPTADGTCGGCDHYDKDTRSEPCRSCEYETPTNFEERRNGW